MKNILVAAANKDECERYRHKWLEKDERWYGVTSVHVLRQFTAGHAEIVLTGGFWGRSDALDIYREALAREFLTERQSERALTDLAARALGFHIHVDEFGTQWRSDKQTAIFDPANDDGQALRLAAALNLSLIVGWGFDGEPSGRIATMIGSRDDIRATSTPYDGDPVRAWRKAILRGAAEIGKHTE